MITEHGEFRILRLAWAPHGKPTENEACVEILRKSGFSVLPIRVEGLVKPELTVKGRTFCGIDEISKVEEVKRVSES